MRRATEREDGIETVAERLRSTVACAVVKPRIAARLNEPTP